MKWGVLSQWFDPEPGPAAVPGVLARELARRGNEVTVLTGIPNYPTGRVYPGYHQSWHQVEAPAEGLIVHRVPLFPSHDVGAIGRATNYLSFAAAAGAQVTERLAGCDAVWVYNSPATVPAVAAHLKRRRDVPYLLHLMDVWPDSVLDSGMLNGPLGKLPIKRMLNALVRSGYDHASRIAVTSPGQARLLVERGVPEEKVVYRPLWADEDLYQPRGRDRTQLPDAARDATMVWMYAGAMGHVQGLDHAIRAVARARSAGVHLVFVGQGIAEPSLRRLAEELGAANVHFMGRRPPSDMGALTAAADVHLVALADTPLLRMTMPSKVQSIMAVGRPIIATCVGDAAAAVEESGAGLALPPGDVDRLSTVLIELAGSWETLEQWGRAAREHYQRTFSRSAAVDQVETMLREMAK